MEHLQASSHTIDKSKRKGFSSLDSWIFLDWKSEHFIASKSNKQTDIKDKFLVKAGKA